MEKAMLEQKTFIFFLESIASFQLNFFFSLDSFAKNIQIKLK